MRGGGLARIRAHSGSNLATPLCSRRHRVRRMDACQPCKNPHPQRISPGRSADTGPWPRPGTLTFSGIRLFCGFAEFSGCDAQWLLYKGTYGYTFWITVTREFSLDDNVFSSLDGARMGQKMVRKRAVQVKIWVKKSNSCIIGN